MMKVGSRSLRTPQSKRKWGPKPHKGWLRDGPAWREWARGWLHRHALPLPSQLILNASKHQATLVVE
eukprot:15474194-Alexandrium_andersonii.AAC.1